MSENVIYYENEGNLPLLNLIPRQGKRVLDLGCGCGSNARILKTRDYEVVGVTISPKELNTASEFCECVYLSNLDDGIPPVVGNGYDIVLMSHIIEHLFAPENVLRDIPKVLNSDGLLAMAIPNVLVYYMRFNFLLGKFEYTREGILDETHVKFYTYLSSRRLFELNGFEIVSAKGDGSFPIWKIRKILPSSIKKKINEWVCKLWPGLFATQFLYIAKVKQ